MFNFSFLKRFLLYLTHLITGGKYTGIRKTNICKCDINVIMLKVRINCEKPKPFRPGYKNSTHLSA